MQPLSNVMQTVHRRRHRGVFAVSLAISIAAHIAAVTLIPRDVKHIDLAPPTLEVILARPMEALSRPKPLPLMPKPQARRQAEQRKAIERPKAEQEAHAQEQVTAQPPPLASSAPTDPMGITLPEVGESQMRAQKAGAVALPQSPSPAVREAGDVTPPSFNAAYLRNPPPHYPILARRNGMAGRVLLKVRVTAEGRPADVHVDRSSGSSVLDNAAVDAVRNWQFVPGRREQKPIESSVVVPIVSGSSRAGP